ncbi:radical SAM protein [Candidatus Woesearchaeota archaeon]|jgi:radical SAM superfamily enzyme YgiQ (UPF0313 family)|nr:radical SAM protein [Candidatus Woesearchaeota archaeon]MBT4368455.1 radical SAM protein [Candidatus Woesearchaeota archaeon]MBT4712944.1 radical SAM protein [Candidatus Woesearchaeota archaeon]MBT6639856.1 radical SAM protein [Candidatus Woesearchaeota archaeon]MBT7134028.1 radical SAM protein [Candidatus Woesearchaeota archaeon]
MKNILLVYLPFCTPVTPPYSLTHLHSVLKANTDHNITVLDLNLEFHKLKFPEFKKYCKQTNWDDYEEVASKFTKESGKVYSENNKKVVNGEKPELFNELLNKIKEQKPDLVAFSIVYSSQAFYATALLRELNIPTVIGGPAVNDKLKKLSTYLSDEAELLNYLNTTNTLPSVPDFSIYNLDEYFTPHPVIPLKTSSSCYYKKCTFCTHYNQQPYQELPIEDILKTIISSKQKHFFLIDDMIHKTRLLKLAKAFKPLNISWTCQLKPTIDLDLNTLTILRESGLKMIMWGVESASNRILKLINKGTNVKDIQTVLKNSHDAGIKNVVYMIAGFPSETKEEFLESIKLIETNPIDLVSFSVFGLQKNTEIFSNPNKFQIKSITEHPRTVLEPNLTYEVKSGLTQKQAAKLRDNYQKTILKVNTFPRSMNFFREHMLTLL